MFQLLLKGLFKTLRGLRSTRKMTKARKDKQRKSLKIDIEITPRYSCESRCTASVPDVSRTTFKSLSKGFSFIHSQKQIKKLKRGFSLGKIVKTQLCSIVLTRKVAEFFTFELNSFF